MPPVGFEPTISAGERPQTYALDRAATGTGLSSHTLSKTTNIKEHKTINLLIVLCGVKLDLSQWEGFQLWGVGENISA